MEKQTIVIANKADLREEFENALKRFINSNAITSESFNDDKLSLSEASQFAGMSIPTFSKRVKDGTFKKHGTARKIFFLKSELIEAMRNH